MLSEHLATSFLGLRESMSGMVILEEEASSFASLLGRLSSLAHSRPSSELPVPVTDAAFAELFPEVAAPQFRDQLRSG